MRRWKDWLASQWLWQIFLVLAVGAGVLLQAPALQHLEWRLYDRVLRWAPIPSPVLNGISVEIDARSLAGQGSDLQTQLARLVHLLQKDGARGIGILLPLETDPGLPPWLTALGQTLQESALVSTDRASVNRMQRLLGEGERDLDRTRLLSRVMTESGMTYLSFRFGAQPDAAPLPDALLQRAIPPRPGTTVLPRERQALEQVFLPRLRNRPAVSPPSGSPTMTRCRSRVPRCGRVAAADRSRIAPGECVGGAWLPEYPLRWRRRHAKHPFGRQPGRALFRSVASFACGSLGAGANQGSDRRAGQGDTCRKSFHSDDARHAHLCGSHGSRRRAVEEGSPGGCSAHAHRPLSWQTRADRIRARIRSPMGGRGPRFLE